MQDFEVHSPEWLREQALKCFRLAGEAWDDGTRDALTEYGYDLLDRANRMDAAIEHLSRALRTERRKPH